MHAGRTAAAAVLTTAILVTGGCRASAERGVSARLRLVVVDNHVRAEGDECAGARPYRYVHAGAPFSVEAEDETVLVEGELPPGRAENADPSIEWGVERFPTVCVIDLTVDDLPPRPRYLVRLPEGAPLAFEVPTGARDEPIVLIVQ